MLKVFHLVLLASGLCAVGAQETAAICSGEDAFSINETCFTYFPGSKTWEQAKKACESLPEGGVLAQFHSKDELLKLVPSVNGITIKYFWIGANDIAQEGTFRWTDGSAANLSGMWGAYTPDNYLNEDCVMVLAEIKQLNDVKCTLTLPFMCMRKTCTPVVDLIYVLDSSSSIGQNNFQKQISFAIDLVSKLKIRPFDVNVGAVVFSFDAVKYFDLKDLTSFADLSKNLSAIPYKGVHTRTYNALDFIINDGMFSPAAGSRNNSLKTVIVITDGKSDNLTKTQQAANRVKDQGYTINAVGIGDAVDSELSAIASSASNVFKTDDVDALKKIVNSVIQQACPVI